MNPKIAIIVLNWCQPKLTINCVKSILKGSYRHFNIYIIDNYSDDNSKEMFESKFKNNLQVKIIQTKENLGYTGGNNYGLKIATHKNNPEYVCILNNDTMVNKQFLSEIVKAIKIHGSNNIFFPLILNWKSNTVQSGGLTDFLPTPLQFKYRGNNKKEVTQIEESKYLSGCCFVIKTKQLQSYNGFDESFFMYGEDIDFGIRARALGSKLLLIPKSHIHHRGASGFSPLAAYYSTRNNFYLISRYSKHKAIEFFRSNFWFLILVIYHLLKMKPKIAVAFIKGELAYFKGETGKFIPSSR